MIRLLRNNLKKDYVIPRIRKLIDALFNETPTGVGSKGRIRFSSDEERELFLKGARWLKRARMN
jgi:tRNA-splicing ligase RtcB